MDKASRSDQPRSDGKLGTQARRNSGVGRYRWALGLHPVLFAAYPVLHLLASNIREVAVETALRSLLLSVLAALLLLGLMYLILRDRHRAGLIVSFGLLIFFSYGHLYAALKTWTIAGEVVGRHRYLLPLAAGLMGVWTWWVICRLRQPAQAETFFTLVGLAALVLPVYTVVVYLLSGIDLERSAAETPAQVSGGLSELPSGDRPDIYYIIVDGYARQDVLADLYGYDNSEFLDFLADQGFYVAERAHSNYMQTVLSLSSSLNMQYLDEVAARQGSDSEDIRPLHEMIVHSQVRGLLAGIGYQMIAFNSGWAQTDIEDADFYFAPDPSVHHRAFAWTFNEFEGMLLESTLVRAFLDQQVLASALPTGPFEEAYLLHRERVLFTLERLGEIAQMEGDYFVFAHIVSPHPPFVFGPNGEPLAHASAFTLADANAFQGPRQDYVEGYRDQLIYLNKILARTLTRIIARSETPPIIILQADHGPGAYMTWGSPETTNMRERLSILNAYFFPGHADAGFYPSITPVNTFRLLLNAYFGGEYAMLPDKSYFAEWQRPYTFLDVTERSESD